VPEQFGWIDHRLVRDKHIRRCDYTAWALYLFLVIVGDQQGLSYYSDRSIQKFLSMDQETLRYAKRNLLQAGFIAFDVPIYQVLALDHQRVVEPPTHEQERVDKPKTHCGPEAIGDLLRRLREAS
jgi:hypothetical protein